MKKKIFTLLLALVAIATTAQAQVVLNETNFPDANFRKALASILKISEGDEITAEKIAKTTSLSVLGRQIADLTGIEHFTALTRLNCGGNQLTTLDVSKNTALTDLGCYKNQLTSLDVSGCTALTNLQCNYNQLTTLDVSKNTALKELYCYKNRIKGKAMDALVNSLPTVENGPFSVVNYNNNYEIEEGNICTKLQVTIAKEKGWRVENYEGCDPNIKAVVLNAENFPDANFRKALALRLRISEGDEITEEKIAATTSLNVYNEKVADLTGIEYFTELTELHCYDNQLTSLDVSKNTALTRLDCYNNQLTSLDVSKNTALTRLDCHGNQLTSLDVSKNTALTGLNCSINRLASLDVSQNTTLEYLDCDRIGLTALDVSKNTALKVLRCYSNQLTSLDVSKNTALTGLDCYRNQLASLDVSKNTALQSLNCNSNQLTSLDVSKNTALTRLDCAWNQLTSLDVSKNTALTMLVCNNNQLASLDVSKNTALTSLTCSGNQLTSFDVSKNTALTSLTCSGNQLASLDVSKNTALTDLDCYKNQLTSLDVSKNTALKDLRCYDNQLTSLDMSGCTVLQLLDCSGNQLASLDVSKNTALTTLDCSGNQLTSLDLSNQEKLTIRSLDTQQLTAKAVRLEDGRMGINLGVEEAERITNLKKDNSDITSVMCGTYLVIAKKAVATNCPKKVTYQYDTKYPTKATTMDVVINIDKSDLPPLLLNTDNFPDANFRAALVKELGISEGDEITNEMIAATTSIDVSSKQIADLTGIEHFTALTNLNCGGNRLISLDVSQNTALTLLYCHSNQLTSLDVSQNTALRELYCFSNQIKGEAIDALVASLPTVESGKFYVINTKDANEGNVCTKSQVAIAKGKGWTVYDFNGGNYPYLEYEGSEDPEQEIDPVDEDDNIDYGNDMDENSDLDGNVIGDIFYNISSGNGEYNSEEGCIVVTKPTDDGTVDDLEGKDIFGEDFKSQFTGIVFKVPAGKGTIKVDAETTGNMLLKVKIGSNDPVEMELNGKLKVTFPYNVSEATYVYIYAGAANEAKGFGKASATDAALKIYGIEFLRDDTPTDIDRPTPDPSLNGGENWYTIDGVKLNGEPTKKGVYIVKGKKVVK